MKFGGTDSIAYVHRSAAADAVMSRNRARLADLRPYARRVINRGAVRWVAAAIVAAVLAALVLWVLFVPAADWLARHDAGSATGTTLATARDDARGQLLTLGAGLLATGALVFTARNFTLSREGQVTDRYTKAIEQLGSDKIDIRIGGIYALERIARDSAKDHPTVIEVLSAFIREHSCETKAPPDAGDDDNNPDESWETQKERAQRQTQARIQMRADIAAAVSVIRRRNSRQDIRTIDLSRTDLSYADLSGADLAGAKLVRADLTGANLADANLSGADLTHANLYAAFLPRVILSGAALYDACLDGAGMDNAILISSKLSQASLQYARLHGACLTQAKLLYANMTGVDLTSANLADADLRRANLTDVKLTGTDLTNANLLDAVWNGPDSPPPGWLKKQDGRLARDDK